MKTLYTLVFLIVSFFIIVSCGSNIEDTIVGKWKEFEKDERIEFFADSTFKVTGGIIYFDGTYSFESNNKIKLKMSGFSSSVPSQVWKIKIFRDIMTVVDEDGESTKFQRGN